MYIINNFYFGNILTHKLSLKWQNDQLGSYFDRPEERLIQLARIHGGEGKSSAKGKNTKDYER